MIPKLWDSSGQSAPFLWVKRQYQSFFQVRTTAKPNSSIH